MLTLKSEAIDDLKSLIFPYSVSQDLENWQNLSLSLTQMEHERQSNNRNSRNNTQRSRSTSNANTTRQQQQTHHLGLGGASEYDTRNFVNPTTGSSIPSDVQDAALLAQFAAAAGSNDLSHLYSGILAQNAMTQNLYPSMNPTPGFYGSFLHHNSMPPPQLPPLASLDFNWNSSIHDPQPGPSQHTLHQSHSGSSMQTIPYLNTSFNPEPPHQENPRSSRRGGQSTAGGSGSSQGHSTSSPEVETTEAERQVIADEKRRRNTAASARFRIKKKHKTINLERSVSDLTGRAEELEREAADLRRENGWLKEIVMLKGTRFAASNLAHREALAQAAALAIGGSISQDQTGGGGSAGASGSGQSAEDQQGSESESSGSEYEDEEQDKKGKRKQDSKSKKT